ncbi:BRO family protein [Nostoc sp. DedQUE07]|uniref:BRO family protein n=1 Tax=Nostoc sp. DedQUE07 TaxID=3075392 RepID=UPI002AD30FA9|nr:BRO family protein [Nostoc sp. DedQUE07]MDZ8132239.1 BRO family protein [Nostoc sp. DedQUE07]
MSNLSIFSFESHEIRFVGTADEPWWVASDLCSVLDIVNVRQNLAKLDEDEKGVCTIYTKGGEQQVATVNESGLYLLILNSRKPQAKRFRKWLTSEVIPSIRKTGTYGASSQKHLPVVNNRLSELKASEAVARHDIKVLENELANKKRELQNIQQELFTEAKAVLDANAELAKQVLDAKEIIERAKQANKYLSV